MYIHVMVLTDLSNVKLNDRHTNLSGFLVLVKDLLYCPIHNLEHLVPCARQSQNCSAQE